MLFSIYIKCTRVSICAYLCELCMMGRWPLCTKDFWIWIRENDVDVHYISLYFDEFVLRLLWELTIRSWET